MKKQILSRGAMTLICSAILAACGSSGGGSLAVENVPNVPSAAELEQAKQAAANAEQKLSEAQQNLNAANQKLKDAQTSGQTTTTELNKVKKELADAQVALKDAEKNAEAAQRAADAESKLSDAQKALNDANQKLKDAETNGKTTTAELDKVKKELADAQTALKDAEKNAETAQKKAVEEAKETAVKDYIEQQKMASVKAAIQESFVGTGENNLLPEKSDTVKVHTNVITIDNKSGVAKTEVNQTENPEIKSITINGVKLGLLDKATGNTKIHLQELQNTDFPNDKMPDGAKGGWVGSYDGDRSYSNFSQMRFGAYTDENNVSHLFVNGTPSSAARMIQAESRIAEFAGSAILGKDGAYQAIPESITGSVNFKNKEVKLKLTADAENSFNISGKINGNTFAGVSDDGTVTQGGFYGSFVDTLGGTLQINKEGKYKGYNGVYGAGQK